ncbi:hypothetical protein PHYC_02436 [Phycisphaerales bacterium]|nr:hypothetical protein PHYC_02436 [Phycisphaerales bacterium]
MNRSTLLAEAVEQSRTLLARYLPGFTDANRTTQAPGLPNHFAWNLGHLALTMHRVAGMIDGKDLPQGDFIKDSVKGDSSHFGTESVCFGSVPTDEPARYPGVERCVAVFDAAVARLAGAARTADDATLDRAVPWGKATSTPGALTMRMAFHNGVHCGQIVDLRRALKLGNVLS